MEGRKDRLRKLVATLERLPEARLHWVERVTELLHCRHRFVLHYSGLLNQDWTMTFGDGLMIHHAFSNEPFTKDKFEHALVNTGRMVGIEADFAPRGNRGHDITIDNVKISLKTQADKDIKSDILWISKYMELGKGDWSDKPRQLEGLRDAFLEHLKASERILMLRCVQKSPHWKYELVEIPKAVLEMCSKGTLEMKLDSKQLPKPGYCHVYDAQGRLAYQLYFDGGGERKLQVKALRKDLCILHAEWQFEPTVSGNNE